MGTEIKFKTVATPEAFRKQGRYCRGCVIHNKVLEIDEIGEDFAQYAKLDPLTAQYNAKLFVNYMVDAVKRGYRLNLGAFSLFLTMKGQVSGANGGFDQKKNSLELNIRSMKSMLDALASLEPVNVTMDGETLRISSVMDELEKTEGVLTLGEKVYASGHTFLVDTSRDDEGVWLENADGKKVLRAEDVASTATTLDCIFRGALEPGEYRFAVSTRMGDASRKNPAVVRRKVTVR